jgi:RNA polymerase sigma-70 factor (ECF subfamily)
MLTRIAYYWSGSLRLRAYYRHQFTRIGRRPTEAEDLVQEALIAIHTHRHTYDESQLLTPWVHAIARFKFLDYLRRTKSSLRNILTCSPISPHS